MIEHKLINDFRDELVRLLHPVKVVLFGSYATGNPTPDSDVDMLVVMPFEGKAAHKSAEILNLLNQRFPIDLLVRTPEQIEDRLSEGDFFLGEILNNGKILYEATDVGVGGKSGRGLRNRVA